MVATLLDNALVHGAGTVTIRTSQTPKSVVIEVRDEGRGVPPELVPRIFERSVSGRLAVPGSASRWPAASPPPTAARWCWSGPGRPCSRCSSRAGCAAGRAGGGRPGLTAARLSAGRPLAPGG